jgi:plasmid maintenance system antidote protein VapI
MNGKRAITAQMAHRLARAFETTPQYWLNLQTIYELKKAGADMPEDALAITPCAVAVEGTASQSV